jgi:hypothetical protein
VTPASSSSSRVTHVGVQRSFTMFAGATLRTGKQHRESASAIRSKNRFWRAPMRREGGGHENFFIAKNRDSESAQRAFNRQE